MAVSPTFLFLIPANSNFSSSGTDFTITHVKS
jgi:hypothetical protein